MPPPECSTASLLQGVLDLSQSRCAIFAFAVGGLVVYCIGLLFYRLWLHPLSKIPGPKLLAVTGLPYLYQEHVQGTWVRRMAELHRQYGPIVRIAPNGLALDGSIAWPEVYAHRKGKTEFLKKKNYFFPGDEGSLVQSSTEVHRRQRRQLAHAFSDAALYEQEPITNQYISLLIQQLSLRAEKGEPVDVTKWMNFTTFDIIGDLTYADSFHCLDSNDYHPWVLSIFQGIRGIALGRFIDALPLLKPLITLAMSTDGIKKEVDNRKLAVTKARSRMEQGESPSGRRDFMTYMMRSGRDGGKGMLDHEILLNSPLLVTAGSETTATALSGFLYYLANNPEVYRALIAEIRDAFKSESGISVKTTAPLQYLHACIEETLRVYPPVAETPPRVSPGDIIAGYWVPEGTLVCTYQWATFRNPENFVDPDSFSPERWLPSAHPRYNRKFERDNHSVFKPFSHGPRDCIGKNLAYSEMRVIIARFLYKFDYVLDGDHDDWHTCQNIYLIWEKGPLMLKLMPRKMEVERLS